MLSATLRVHDDGLPHSATIRSTGGLFSRLCLRKYSQPKHPLRYVSYLFVKLRAPIILIYQDCYSYPLHGRWYFACTPYSTWSSLTYPLNKRLRRHGFKQRAKLCMAFLILLMLGTSTAYLATSIVAAVTQYFTSSPEDIFFRSGTAQLFLPAINVSI